jgi:hypothetical protein
MSNSMKGMIAGLVATLVLSGLLLLKSTAWVPAKEPESLRQT